MSATSRAGGLTPVGSQRSDARRNREAILVAAERWFLSHGENASINEIAKSAGVGVGTVYRHFSSKQAMLGALLSELFDGAADRVRALSDAGGDPFEQFARALDIGATDVASHPLCQAILDQKSPAGAWAHADAARAMFAETFRPLVQAAHADGSLRGDFEAGDVGAVMAAICSVVDVGRPRSWRLFLDIIVSGLRAH